MVHEVLRATSDSQLFLVTAAPYVVLDTDLHSGGRSGVSTGHRTDA
ncbi:hypothetical protein [Streptomyces rimosus]|nr:hypothetical protein [Streptomyces rimosus]